MVQRALIIALSLAPAAAQAGRTRDQMLETASELVFHPWQMTAANQQLPRSCAVQPANGSYRSTVSLGPQTGLAYGWGGFMGVAEFDRRLAAGAAAGSHSWHGGAIASCVAGVDCSGFVSQAWGLSAKASSTSLSTDSLTVSVPVDQLLPGDILDRAGKHVVLVLGKNSEGDLVFMESAGSSGARVHSGWSYVQGYVPRRYRYVDPAPQSGTRDTPVVATLPFEDHRRTLVLGKAAIDGFQCAAGEAEGGGFGQTLYTFTLREASVVRVEAQGDGHVALRLLAGPSGDQCRFQADDTLSAGLEPGTWLLSVAGGPKLPVALSITATPSGAPPASAAPTSGGSPVGALELLALVLGAVVGWVARRRRVR